MVELSPFSSYISSWFPLCLLGFLCWLVPVPWPFGSRRWLFGFCGWLVLVPWPFGSRRWLFTSRGWLAGSRALALWFPWLAAWFPWLAALFPWLLFSVFCTEEYSFVSKNLGRIILVPEQESGLLSSISVFRACQEEAKPSTGPKPATPTALLAIDPDPAPTSLCLEKMENQNQPSNPVVEESKPEDLGVPLPMNSAGWFPCLGPLVHVDGCLVPVASWLVPVPWPFGSRGWLFGFSGWLAGSRALALWFPWLVAWFPWLAAWFLWLLLYVSYPVWGLLFGGGVEFHGIFFVFCAIFLQQICCLLAFRLLSFGLPFAVF
ncbi:hypothetical protein KFK09_022302 [Dendrobium nobile]|uniref:Uncharacterized protein n=1 Tax=Dendrobium nobile TaxID=94219 RepID=A0A8T3APE8_DENNO|nr:hypothetical protein KFK09_022302 [Dendrobium nobile]